MGKAARWLRGLFLSGKKQGSGVSAADPKPVKEKRRWGFTRSFRDKDRGAGEPKEAADAAVLEERKGSYRDVSRSHVSPVTSVVLDPVPADSARALNDGEAQNKRAIAVAAATAAVAEAAVAAAQAAAAVVRLTSSGRSASMYGSIRKGEDWAAVKIQAAFRGYLARRALKALKGLVKLQALVRGHIVRKQAAETLRCMQALVRVQARARACRSLSEKRQHKGLWPPHPRPPTPEKYEPPVSTNGAKVNRPGTLKKNDSKTRCADTANLDQMHSSGWNWLDRWMEERYWDSRELHSRTGAVTDDEKNDKILEIDTGKPQLSSKRRMNRHSSCSTLASDQNSHSFATVWDSPSKDSTTAQFSIPSPSSVEMQQSLSPLRFPVEAGETCESPQFFSASSRPGSSRRGPFTPAKSECSRSLFSGYSDYPNYMANTESSKAKIRSQSAPKQRPEFEKSASIKRLSMHGFGYNCGQEFEKSASMKRLSVHGFGYNGVQSSSSQRSSSSLQLKFTSKAYPASGSLDRLGMPART